MYLLFPFSSSQLCVLIEPSTATWLPFFLYCFKFSACLSHTTTLIKSADLLLPSLSFPLFIAKSKLAHAILDCVYLSSTSFVNLPIKITRLIIISSFARVALLHAYSYVHFLSLISNFLFYYHFFFCYVMNYFIIF